MRLHRLRIVNFAAIGNVEVELGPGLNVLYGPNDLGKSTVVAAIRLGLLLPHTSTHCEQYIGWTGAGDPTGSGKEQIAAALQAVAQAPLFVALLRSAQARRDEAYTDKGAKKTAKGSVFKAAAERLNEARDEKERLQRIVADSEGAERQVRELTD